MSTAHDIDIFGCKEIWSGIKDYHNEAVKRQEKKNSIMKVKRTVFLEHWGPRLKSIKEDTTTKFDRLYSDRRIN